MDELREAIEAWYSLHTTRLLHFDPYDENGILSRMEAYKYALTAIVWCAEKDKEEYIANCERG
jgi:hypothetical protein